MAQEANSHRTLLAWPLLLVVGCGQAAPHVERAPLSTAAAPRQEQGDELATLRREVLRQLPDMSAQERERVLSAPPSYVALTKADLRQHIFEWEMPDGSVVVVHARRELDHPLGPYPTVRAERRALPLKKEGRPAK